MNKFKNNLDAFHAHLDASREFTPHTVRFIEYDSNMRERWRSVWTARKNSRPSSVEDRIKSAMRGSVQD